MIPSWTRTATPDASPGAGYDAPMDRIRRSDVRKAAQEGLAERIHRDVLNSVLRSNLPEGVVSIVFTDVERSTALVARRKASMKPSPARSTSEP